MQIELNNIKLFRVLINKEKEASYLGITTAHTHIISVKAIIENKTYVANASLVPSHFKEVFNRLKKSIVQEHKLTVSRREYDETREYFNNPL